MALLSRWCSWYRGWWGGREAVVEEMDYNHMSPPGGPAATYYPKSLQQMSAPHNMYPAHAHQAVPMAAGVPVIPPVSTTQDFTVVQRGSVAACSLDERMSMDCLGSNPTAACRVLLAIVMSTRWVCWVHTWKVYTSNGGKGRCNTR